MIKVTFNEVISMDYPSETTVKEISESFKKYYNYPVLLAKVDNDLVELGDKISKDCNIDFYDRSSSCGNAVYERSLQFILILAVKRVLGANSEVVIEHSIDKGFYCEIINADLDKPVLKKIENEMHNIVKADLIFTKVSVDRLDAIKFFEKKKQLDKVKVLKYISNSFINLYRLDDLYDYFYGDMAYSTKDIDDFKLTYIKNNGFVVSYPKTMNPECTLDYVHHRMVFDTFLKYTEWGRTQNVSNAADLNEIVSKGKYDQLIMVSEAYQNQYLMEIANKISDNRKNIKIILIAGPSSSGKTTTSKKLAIYLKTKGINSYQISVDDYFKDRDATPLKPNGEPDFESLRAVDTNLFNRHLSKLLNGERVLIPEYNFVLGKKEFNKNYIKLKEDDVIIIEGLHCLNEELTMSIERKNKFKMYISPLTQMNIDNHSRIHTSDTRKLRRIVRDNRTRGYEASDTLKMWNSIREGEEQYIFPYQDDADVVFNTSLIYEIGVLKTYVEPLLFSVSSDDPTYPEALRLINFLRNFLPIPSDMVPNDSILREFIGRSAFNKNE